MAKATRKGTDTKARILVTAVSDTDKATSPLASLEMMLLVTPPGQKLRIIKPAANTGEKSNKCTVKKASKGRNSTCAMSAIATTFLRV